MKAGSALTSISVLGSSLALYVAFSFLFIGTSQCGAAVRKPSNDNFSRSKKVSGPAAVLQGKNTGATPETGEPQTFAPFGGRSVWWKWSAPASGLAIVTSATSKSIVPFLAAYIGSSVSNLTLLAADPDGLIAFEAVKGTTYYIRVDSYPGGEGSFKLNLTLSTLKLTLP